MCITSQLEHTTNTQQYRQWKRVCKTKHWQSEWINSVFLQVTLVLLYSNKSSDKKHWLTKYAQSFKSIGGVQQPFCWFYKQIRQIFYWEIRGRRSKAKSIMQQYLNGRWGGRQHWQLNHHFLNHSFCFGNFTVKTSMGNI